LVNGLGTHVSLDKNAPIPRAVQAAGHITAATLLHRLHHRYVLIQFSAIAGAGFGNLHPRPVSRGANQDQ